MKQTIAEKVASAAKPEVVRKKRHLFTWVTCLPLGTIAYFCKYVLPGYSFTALVCLCLIAVILFYSIVSPVLCKIMPGFGRLITRLFTIALCLGLLVVGATEAVIIKASLGQPNDTADFVVVLGAKVRPDGPSVSLQDRIDAAYDYLTAHPEMTAVVSGGQGNDEHMTEAECMYQELTGMGIAPGRVWMENKASSTWENLNFSLNLIEERTGTRPEKIAVLSSEYHLFRASLLAKKCDVEFIGVPAATSRWSQRINHFMREVAGVWHYLILGGTYSD